MIKIFYFILISVILSMHISAQNFWEPTNGPQVAGAGISNLVINSNDYIFASTGDGIFRSTDNADNWVSINSGLTELDIHCMVTNQNDNLFVGTDDGVFISTNNGDSWTKKNNGIAGLQIISLAVNSDNFVFAATYNSVYRSSNNGENWIKKSNGLIDLRFGDLTINSSNKIFIGAYEGIYSSTNNGESWNQINTGINGLHVYSLGISKNDVIIVNYFLPYRWPQYGEGIRSTDNGETWSSFNIDTSWFNIYNYAFDSNDKFFASTSKGLFKSEDQGANWTQINSNNLIKPLALNSNNVLYAGSNGIIKSTDGGVNWIEKNQGLFHHAEIHYMTINSYDQIFAGYMATIFSSTDNGNNWIVCFDSINSGYLNSLVINSINCLYAGYYNQSSYGILKSTDNGSNWIEVFDTTLSFSISSLSIDQRDNIYAGTLNGIYRSTDKGNNWEYHNVLEGYVTSIAFNSNSDIYVTDPFDIIMRSTNNGNTWTKINIVLDYPLITSLFIDLNDFIYIATQDGKIYRSTNDGENWIEKSLLSRVTCFSKNTDNYLFAGTWSDGIFISTDCGENWIQKNSGLPHSPVNTLVINSENYLYSGIKHGVYRSSAPTDTYSYFNPTYYYLLQNFPNPFNPTTLIRYQIPESEFVTIKVYDILGKEVAILVNEEKPAGNYEVPFDGNGLTSGIYFYKLTAGEYSETKKMILLK